MAKKTGSSKKPAPKRKVKHSPAKGKKVASAKKKGKMKPVRARAKVTPETVKTKRKVLPATPEPEKRNVEVKKNVPKTPLSKKIDPDFFHDDDEKEGKVEVEFIEETEEIEFSEDAARLDDLHTLDDDEEEVFGAGDDF